MYLHNSNQCNDLQWSPAKMCLFKRLKTLLRKIHLVITGKQDVYSAVLLLVGRWLIKMMCCANSSLQTLLSKGIILGVTSCLSDVIKMRDACSRVASPNPDIPALLMSHQNRKSDRNSLSSPVKKAKKQNSEDVFWTMNTLFLFFIFLMSFKVPWMSSE